MSWQSILKKPFGMFPDDEQLLIFDILSSENTKELMDMIESGGQSDSELQTLKRRINALKSDDAKIQGLIEQYSRMPENDLDLAQIKANLDKISEMLPKQTGQETPDHAKEIKRLVNEIVSANYKEKRALVEQLKEIMPKGKDSDKEYPQAKAIIQAQEMIDSQTKKSFLLFNNLPTEKNAKAEELAQLLGSEYKDGMIVLNNVNTIGDYLKLINPIKFTKKNKYTWEIKHIKAKETDEVVEEIKEGAEESLAKKKKIRELMGELSFQRVFKGKVKSINDVKSQALRDIYFGVKYKISGSHIPFTRDSIKTYISNYERIPKSPTQMVPTWLFGVSPDKENYNQASSQEFATTQGSNIYFPQILFLERASGNRKRLVFNPYGSAILYHSTSGPSWFNTYFKMARQTEFMSEDRAEQLIINDIFDSLDEKHGKLTNSFRYGIPLENYGKTSKGKQINMSNPESARKQIKNNIKNSDTRQKEVRDVTSDLRTKSLNKLEQGWTKAEALSLKEFWKENDYDTKEGKLDIEWYASPLSNEMLVDEAYMNSDGQVDSARRIRDSEYAQIKVTWGKEFRYDENEPDKIVGITEYEEPKYFNPSELVELVQDRLTLRQKKEVKVSLDSEILDKKKKEIEALEEKLKGNISSAKREATTKTIAQKKANLKRYQDYEDSKEKYSAELDKLRSTANVVTNYPEMLVSMAKDKKDSGGLDSLSEEVESSYNKLAVLNNETAIGFLEMLARFYPDDKDFIGIAYREIDGSVDDEDKMRKIAQELDRKMPSFLNKMKELIQLAFQNQLQHLVNFPYKYDKAYVSNILRVFDKSNLIEVV